MNQFTWTFIDNAGKPQILGIAHSATSGNLVIYVNSKVVHVDFEILNAYEYTLFIGEELVHFSIQPDPDKGFLYGCEIDKKADTPRNRRRKATERADWRKIGIAVSGFLLVIVLSSLGAIYFSRQATYQDLPTMLANVGKKTVARLRADYQKGILSYQYVAEGKAFRHAFPISKDSLYVLPNGLQLTDEATFSVVYLPSNPYVYEIDYTAPGATYLAQLYDRAVVLQQQLYPQRTATYHRCLVELAYEEQSMAGLVAILQQQQRPSAYQRLVRAVSFNNKLTKRCW